MRPHARPAAVLLRRIHLEHELEHVPFTVLTLLLTQRRHIHAHRLAREFRARIEGSVIAFDFDTHSVLSFLFWFFVVGRDAVSASLKFFAQRVFKNQQRIRGLERYAEMRKSPLRLRLEFVLPLR